MIAAAAADALLASLLVAIGSSLGGDLRLPLGLPIVLAGFVVALRAVWRADRQARVHWLPSVSVMLLAMAVIGLFTPSLHGARWYEASRRIFSLLAIAAVVVFARGGERIGRRAVTAVVASASLLHFATPIGVPHPDIDVWDWTQTCIRAMLHGVHPYTVTAIDVAGGAWLGRTAAVFPYLPLTLVAFAPGYILLGDYRFVSALCVPATVMLQRATGAKLELDRRLIDAATLAFVLHPRGVFLTCYGWTEPLLVAAAAGFVYLAVRRPDGVGQAIAFLLLPALKQYVVAPVLLYLAMKRRLRVRPLLAAAGVIAALSGPFFLWAWRPTVDGVFHQMIAPTEPRLDSYSLVAVVAILTGVRISRWASVAVQMAAAALAFGRLRRHGLPGLMLASAVALFATFLAGWQAFLNYYYLVAELLLLAALVPGLGPPHAIDDRDAAASTW